MPMYFFANVDLFILSKLSSSGSGTNHRAVFLPTVSLHLFRFLPGFRKHEVPLPVLPDTSLSVCSVNLESASVLS